MVKEQIMIGVSAIEFLARAREDVIILQSRIDRMEAALAATPEAQLLAETREEMANRKADCREHEVAARDIGLKLYEASGDRKPHAALTIKMFKVLDYDAENALAYCREHLPQALKLDRREFEKVAKTVNIPIVTMGLEPRMTIARNLDKWLIG